ncbi:MAG TPA: DUF6580 family putative transport protein [Candidatus Acidoferrum sp.]|jgi:hypothetical protein|nr:DUF6580 family putative transport protein [Candidatus Acidoferrum sp.]
MIEERNDRQLLWLQMGIAGGLILLAAVLRVVAHPWNFTPVGAMALFSGATFRQRWLKFAFPLVALFAGDVLVGLYKLMCVIYASFLISVAIGMWIGEERKIVRLAGGTFLGALQFFLITNFGIWATFLTYPKTAAGLLSCYAAGLPLFWNTLAGDLCYVGLLFGGYALAKRLILRAPVEMTVNGV